MVIEYADTEPDTEPTELRRDELTHRPDCSRPAVHRRDGIRHARLVCTTCGATATVPLRREWMEAEE